MRFQLLDADYFLNGAKPVIRLFGKTENGNAICAFYDKFQPYFYVKQGKGSVAALKAMKEITNIEEVKRFIPLGYKKEPESLLMITVDNPQNVPKLRDELVQNGFEDFDSDIMFKYRFMVDFGVKGMDWIEFEGTKAFTKMAKVTSYHVNKMKKIEKNENADLKFLAFDIECLPADLKRPMDSKKDPIVMVSLSFSPDHKNQKSLVLVAKPVSSSGVQGFRSEKELLEEFIKVIENYDPDMLIGYNCNNFDLPYLLDRMRKHGIQPNFGRCEKNVFSKTFGMMQECIVPGRIVVDPYQILKRDPWVKFHRYNLNTIAKELLNEEKIDVEHTEMPDLWNGGREGLNKFIEYCRKDSELAIRLVLEKGMLDRFFELSKISGLLLQDTFGGQSSRVETMLLHEFRKKNFVMPSRPSKEELLKRTREREKKELKGATVLEPKKGLHTEGCILVLDFRSLYPSIMRTYNVSPDTVLLKKENVPATKSPTGAYFVNQAVREGIFPSLLKELISARGRIKKMMKSAKDEEKRILNAKQLALKDMSNSFYGYTGYIRARLYMIDVANTITAHGRKNLEKTKKLIEDNFAVEVLYADTDSVFLKTNIKDLDEAKKEGSKIAKFVSDKLPGYLELEFEKIYKTFLILTKKRYAGWEFEPSGDGWVDKIEMKGIETIRRDWCTLVSETMEEVIKIILKEGDIQKAISRVRTVMTSLKNNEVPLEKLTIIKGITKSLESYEGMLPHIELAKKIAKRNPSEAPVVGDRIGFVIIRGNLLLSKRSEDPRYAREHNLQIDSDYYIYSQLFPPIERILSAVGISKSELLGNGRQASMKEVFSKNSKKKPAVLKGWESFVCKRCNKSYRRMPLSGACECGGDLMISYHGTLGNKVKR